MERRTDITKIWRDELSDTRISREATDQGEGNEWAYGITIEVKDGACFLSLEEAHFLLKALPEALALDKEADSETS